MKSEKHTSGRAAKAKNRATVKKAAVKAIAIEGHKPTAAYQAALKAVAAMGKPPKPAK